MNELQQQITTISKINIPSSTRYQLGINKSMTCIFNINFVQLFFEKKNTNSNLLFNHLSFDFNCD